jgi:dipeptidyl aminopeptidase/acylaminoacyl peptidase
VSGLDPVRDRDALDAYCPVRHVSSAFPPTLFLHSDADRDVPHQASLSMREALRAVGADADLVTVPRCGHMFEQVGTAQAKEAFGRVIQFLQARVEFT